MPAVAWLKICGCSACGVGVVVIGCSVLSQGPCLGLAEGFTRWLMSRYEPGCMLKWQGVPDTPETAEKLQL